MVTAAPFRLTSDARTSWQPTAERSFKELAEALSEPLCVVHPDGTLLYGNRKWHVLTAILEGKDFHDSLLELIHPEDREAWRSAWRKAVTTRMPYAVERRMRCVSESESDYERQREHGHPVLAADGTVVEWVLCAVPCSENQHLVESLRRSLRRRGEFVAIVAHEIRNSLASITNALHILERHGSNTVVDASARGVVTRQVGHMSRIVEDLLDVARLEHGQLEVRHAAVDLCEVLDRAVEAAQPAMTQRQHNLLLFKTSSPILISGDATRLVQIVVNLLINAAKFTDNGGRIWLILEHDANWARIKVRDTGIGIAPELLSTIFDSYVQADAGRSRSGSGLGLGLALAQQLARLHGGALSAHSDGIGHGSEFVLQLPRVRD